MADLKSDLSTALADRYTIERELGRGGMATVYLAHDLRHDRPVALKVLHPELAATLGPERFQREIRLAARLQHPHILPVLDSGRGRRPALVHHAVRRGRDPARPAAARAAAAGGRRAAHRPRGGATRWSTRTSRAIVHRDIKPENILLTARRRTRCVADFGIARALGASGGERADRDRDGAWARRRT